MFSELGNAFIRRKIPKRIYMLSYLLKFSFILCLFTLQSFPQWSNNPNTPLIVGYGEDPKICSDGSGGCFITYTHENLSYPRKLAVERLNKYGYKPWPIKHITGEYPQQWKARIVEDGQGGVIVGYEDVRENPFYWNVRVQRIDSSGNLLWDSLGVRVSISQNNNGNYKIVSDGENGAVIVWIDGSVEYRINRINSEGGRVWGDSGNSLQTYGNQGSPNLIRGEDSSYYFWVGYNFIKLNSQGEIIRIDSLVAENVVTDENDGVVIQYRGPGSLYRELRAIRLDSLGTNQWPPYVVVAESLYVNNWPLLIKNGDYFFFSWIGNRNGIVRVVQVQSLRLNGSKLFNENIAIGCSGILASDSNKTFIIYNDTSSLEATYVQCLDTLGNKLLADNLMIINQGLGSQNIISEGNGGFIIGGTINNFTIVAQQVSRNGMLGVVPVELISFTTEEVYPGILLKWQTASEKNNKGFEIIRTSASEEDKWEVITFIQGKGTTIEQTNYSFLDTELNYGTYRYRLKQIDLNGSYEYSDIIEVTFGLPQKYELMQNYPNPFNPVTTIKFSLPVEDNVKLTIFNILGEELQVIINGKLNCGVHQYKFDASTLPSGIYLYQLNTDNFTDTKKLILMK